MGGYIQHQHDSPGRSIGNLENQTNCLIGKERRLCWPGDQCDMEGHGTCAIHAECLSCMSHSQRQVKIDKKKKKKNYSD
jgi:hypothetical protein